MINFLNKNGNGVLTPSEYNIALDLSKIILGEQEEKPHYIGVTVDFLNKTITRILGNSLSVNDLKCYKNRIRCNLKDDGTVTARYGDDNYDDVGNENLQVMVEQPAVYYKIEAIELGENNIINKINYIIADGELDGFKLHPAFKLDGKEHDNIYISAFQGTIKNSKLCSIGDGTDLSAYSTSVPNFRTYAKKRGNSWCQETIQTNELYNLLVLIEFQNFNALTALGVTIPITQKMVVGEKYYLNQDGTGSKDKSEGQWTWRFEENPVGNGSCWVDAFFANTVNWYVCENINNLADSVTANYIKVNEPACSQAGNTTRLKYSADFDWLFIPAEIFSEKGTSLIDGFYIPAPASRGDCTFRNHCAGALGRNINFSFNSIGSDITGRLIYCGN